MVNGDRTEKRPLEIRGDHREFDQRMEKYSREQSTKTIGVEAKIFRRVFLVQYSSSTREDRMLDEDRRRFPRETDAGRSDRSSLEEIIRRFRRESRSSEETPQRSDDGEHLRLSPLVILIFFSSRLNNGNFSFVPMVTITILTSTIASKI